MKPKLTILPFLLSVLIYLGHSSYVIAGELSISCAPLRNVSVAGSTVTYEVTNNCGECANITSNTFKNGVPINFAGTWCGTPSNATRGGTYDMTEYSSSFQQRVTRVTTCDVKCP